MTNGKHCFMARVTGCAILSKMPPRWTAPVFCLIHFLFFCSRNLEREISIRVIAFLLLFPFKHHRYVVCEERLKVINTMLHPQSTRLVCLRRDKRKGPWEASAHLEMRSLSFKNDLLGTHSLRGPKGENNCLIPYLQQGIEVQFSKLMLH